MRQIAERADVSIGTVSHVINDTAKVREKLRQRVLEAIRSLGYQPSQLARGLRRNQTNILVMIIPDITNPFFPAVVRGVEDVAYKHSFRLVLCNTDNDAKKETFLPQRNAFLPSGRMAGDSCDRQDDDATHVRQQLRDRRWSVLTASRTGGREMWCWWQTRTARIAPPSICSRMGHRHTGRHHRTAASNQRGGATKRDSSVRSRKPSVPIEPEYMQEARFDRQSGYQAAMRLLDVAQAYRHLRLQRSDGSWECFRRPGSWACAVPTICRLLALTTWILPNLQLRH